MTGPVGFDRINLERNNMDNEINDRSVNPLIRIANALEEILRLVKEDQKKMEEYAKKKIMTHLVLTRPSTGTN